MPNTFLTDDIITLEALSIFENSLAAAKHVDRSKDALFGKSEGGSNRGATIRVRKPNQYTVRTGATYSAQDITDESIALTIDTQIGVDTFVTSKDMTLSLSDFSSQVIKPQVALLANKVDTDVLAAMAQTFNSVGTPGTVPSTLATYLSAGVKLDQYACPRDGQRAMLVGPQMQADIVDGLKGLFNAQGKIGSQFNSGEMGEAAGFNWQMDQNLYVHTVGPLGGTPLVNGAGQTGASLVTDGFTAAAALRLKKNDVFTIAGVYSVNPVSKVSTGVLQQFRVTADVSSDAAGNLTAAIEPSIVTSGATQTVSGSPADNAAITVVGAANALAAQGIAAHKSAVALAFAELPKPQGVDLASTKTDKQLGVSMRFVRWYDGDNDRFKCRFDILYGIKVLRPEWIARVQSGAA
ncbi:MAG TPA: P22 phage major capsid protein family protein [Gemmatimonadaceae bacterium]|nr:P22 phage major capsid protein family protein [Gemmatimonadaceae bacterium]